MSQKLLIDRLKSNSAWLLLNQLSSQGIWFLGTLYLSRSLGVVAFGAFSLAFAIGQTLIVIGDFGVSVYGIRLLAAEAENKEALFSQLLFLRVSASLALFCLVFLALQFLPVAPATYWLLFWGMSIVLANAANCEWAFKGLEKMAYVAMSNTLIAMLFIAAILLWVRSADDLYRATFFRSFVYLPGGIFMLLLLRYKMDFRWPVFSVAIPYARIRESLFYMLSGGVSILYVYAYILIPGFFVEDVALGLFSAAYRLVLIIFLCGAFIPGAFFPILADLYQKDPPRFKSVQYLFQTVLLALSAPITFFGWMFAGDIMGLFYGDAFASAAALLKILVLALPFAFLRLVFSESLMASGHQQTHLRVNVLGSSLAVAMTVILTYFLEEQGTALAFLAGELLHCGLLWYAFRKKLYPPHLKRREALTLILLNSALAAFVCYSDWNLGASVICGALIYAAGLYFSGIFSGQFHALRITCEEQA